MPNLLIEQLEDALLPRKLKAFWKALGEPTVPMSRELMEQIRIMAATSNDGVVLMLGSSAPWVIPWVMDALQPGTRAIALIEPGTEHRIQALGTLVKDDLRLALHVQDSSSFIADMDEQKFDLIIDLDQAADIRSELTQIFSYGCLVRGGPIEEIDARDAVSIQFRDEHGKSIGQLIKPRPATLRRRGGRKARLASDNAPMKPSLKEALKHFAFSLRQENALGFCLNAISNRKCDSAFSEVALKDAFSDNASITSV